MRDIRRYQKTSKGPVNNIRKTCCRGLLKRCEQTGLEYSTRHEWLCPITLPCEKIGVILTPRFAVPRYSPCKETELEYSTGFPWLYTVSFYASRLQEGYKRLHYMARLAVPCNFHVRTVVSLWATRLECSRHCDLLFGGLHRAVGHHMGKAKRPNACNNICKSRISMTSKICTSPGWRLCKQCFRGSQEEEGGRQVLINGSHGVLHSNIRSILFV